MKINEFGKALGASNVKKKDVKKTSGSSEFGDLISGAGEAEETAGSALISKPNSISALDSLLAVQSVETSAADQKQATEHGQELLEFLDDIRLGLLSGSVTQEKINKLKKGINSKRGWVIDKKLTQILDEIELRASVELAKIEMSNQQDQ